MKQKEIISRAIALGTLNQLFLTILLTLSLALLSSCGGGDDGTPTQKPTTTISGTALAPNGVVAQLSNQTFMYALNEFLFPSARADITGLDPVPGALVELIEVNDAGDQVGAVLASTSTSITGDYHLDLPAGVNLAANLVVRITGSSVDLRAMVVQINVDINPLSEFLLRKFITSGASLATLNVDDVATLSGHAEQFDVAATADLSSMLAELESRLGPYVDDSIAAIDSTPGAASSVAGDYHHGSTEMGFDYENDALAMTLYGAQRTYSGAGMVTLTDEGGDNLGGVDLGSTHVDNLQITSNNINYYLSYNVNDDQGGEVFHNIGTVDSGGNINFTFPFGEDINSNNDQGDRKPPSSEIRYASGVAGVLFGTSVNPWATYKLVDTNGDGIKDAVDPTAYVGHKNTFSLEAIAPQASGMTAATLVGEYGGVSLANYFAGTDGFSGIRADVTETSVSASGAFTQTQMDSQFIERTPAPAGTATLTEASDNTLYTGNFNISSNGQFTATVDGFSDSFFGFVSNNGEFMLQSGSRADKTGNDFTAVGNGITLNVRTPGSTPDLSGRTYRLMGIEKQMDASGQIQIQRLRGDDDRLIFSGDGSQVSVAYHGLDHISRIADDEDFSTATNPVSGTIDHSVSIASNGAISFTQTVTGTDGYTREWKGFVSDSNNIIILRSIERATDGSGYKAGIYVAIPVL